MPLIECPDCHSDVSSHAECCPKCGYPISSKNKENEEEEIEEIIYAKPERKQGGGGLFLTSLCIGIIALMKQLDFEVFQALSFPGRDREGG